jgi:anti-sigma regulatory factor (Ser/Thr protein kinase)
VQELREKTEVIKQNEFTLAADLQAPGLARWRTRLAALTWNLPELADDAALCVSELVTNSVQAADCRPGAVVRVSLTADRDSLVLMVRDEGDGMPARRCAAGPLEPGRRGLQIVDALSRSWGAYAVVPAGKVTWCEIRREGCNGCS